MRELSLRRANHLRALGPVRVLALDPCPRCMGRVIASDTEARCVTGCGWTYSQHEPDPVASRRVDA